MVLMPEAYYAATILQQKIYRPCTVPPTDNMYVAAAAAVNNHDAVSSVCHCSGLIMPVLGLGDKISI